MRLRLLAALVLLIANHPAAATWLGTCPGRALPATAKLLDRIAGPDGRTTLLVVAEAAVPGCSMVRISADAAAVKWARLVGRDEARALAGGMLLARPQGSPDEAAPREITALASGVPLLGSVPIGADLLPLVSTATYGVSGRASVREEAQALHIQCAAGTTPAGVLLRSRTGAPLPSGASVVVAIDAETEGRFQFGAADARHARLEESLPLGIIAAGKSNHRFDISPSLDRAEWRFWTIGCPHSSADLAIHGLRLEAREDFAPPRRALWFWNPAAWQMHSAALLRSLAARRADTVFVTIPLTADLGRVADPRLLSSFVEMASANDIRVWAVVGDPQAVLIEERQRYADMAAAFSAYNQSAPPAARLAGLQLDIEPYLNRGYRVDPQAWLSAYLETVSMVRSRAYLPVDLVLPFWWGRQRLGDGLFLDRLRLVADSLTVMNYRTEPRQLLSLAEPFLDWGTRNAKAIRIALEAGPVSVETLHAWRPAPRGKLWLIALDAYAAVLQLSEAGINRHGPAFLWSHSLQQHGSDTSFASRVEALYALVPELEGVWRTWPAFGGIALHGLDAEI